MAQGQKSWLFAGSLRGGELMAKLRMLLHTARLNDMVSGVWLWDVLENSRRGRRPGWMSCCLIADSWTELSLPYRQ